MKEYKLTVSDDGELSLALIPPPPPPRRLLDWRGCNLVGGDSYHLNWPSTGPVSGTHYKFITTTEVDKLIDAGMNCFRLLFAWEAIQPTPYAVLTTLSGNAKAYLANLSALVAHITSRGCDVILDVHGGDPKTFAAYRNVRVGLLYNGQKVEDLLANLWRQLARMFKANPLVHYGITNEPWGIASDVWYVAAQKCINAIRSEGGAGTIVMPGANWTGAGTWIQSNAWAWNLSDPLNNLQFQVHLYLDSDASGKADTIVSETIGADRMREAIGWARYKGIKLFLGEVGISATSPIAKPAWVNLHALMLANADVVSGWAFWAAGEPSWWAKYHFYCGPGSAQLDIISGDLK